MKTRAHKYHAKPVPTCGCCGHRHDSQMEAARCAHWHLLKTAGEIDHVDVHPVVTLPCGRWTLDFAVWRATAVYGRIAKPMLRVHFEDVKGFATEAFKLKRREFDRYHPAAPLRVVKGRKRGRHWAWENI